MRIVEPSAVVEWEQTGLQMMEKIERIGRKCYKSEGKAGPGTAEPFMRMLLRKGHFPMIEHVHVTALIVCDRGVTHELVRHRIASYAQESTRYCNYGQDKFGHEIAVALPHWARGTPAEVMHKPQYPIWERAMQAAEEAYLAWTDMGGSAQDARSVLPTGLKTEIYSTMNLREWMYVFSLRNATDAHPDMRVIAEQLYEQFRAHLPVLFEEDWFRPYPAWRKIMLEILRVVVPRPDPTQPLLRALSAEDALARVREIVRTAMRLPLDGSKDP